MKPVNSSSRSTPLMRGLSLAAVMLMMLTAANPAHSAAGDPAPKPTLADDIKKQQDQIRDRSKDIEDRALAEKQARDREEARKALELREKQWREEYPNAPFPRTGGSNPPPPVPRTQSTVLPQTATDPTRATQAMLRQVEQELRLIDERLSRIEALLLEQGVPTGGSGGGAGGRSGGGSSQGSGSSPQSSSLKDEIRAQQAEIRNRSREIESRAKAEANTKAYFEARREADLLREQAADRGFITPKVISDYYLGPKEPRLR
jgi:hypothetical protein